MKNFFTIFSIINLLFVASYEVHAQCEILYIDTVLIPDDQSIVHTVTLLIEDAEFDAIENIAQVPDVYINFEHSFMGELIISLICPNGQAVALHNGGGGSTYLGEPIDVDNLPDEPGIGYDYTWSSSAVLGTWAQESSLFTALPSGTYSAVGGWENLIGCPVNGQWTIEFVDMFASDNGFLFAYGLGWDSSLNIFGEDCPEFGCYDPEACNYNGSFFGSLYSCVYPGCLDETACNYNPNAGCDDGSCVFPGCGDVFACNYDPQAGCFVSSLCIPSGCMDETACNYNPEAECDNGNCTFSGCAMNGACNFSWDAYFTGCINNDLCVFPECNDPYACNYVPDTECGDVSGCLYHTCVVMEAFQSHEVSCSHAIVSLETGTLGPEDYSFEWIIYQNLNDPISSVWVESNSSYVVEINQSDWVFTTMRIFTGSMFNCCLFDLGADGFIEIPEYSGIQPQIDLDSDGVTAICPNCLDENIDYQWYFNGNPVLGANSPGFSPPMSGVVYLCINEAGNIHCSACSDEAFFIISSVSESRNEHSENCLIVEYASNGNPLVRSLSPARVSFDVFSVGGSLVETHALNPGESVTMTRLSSGVYVVKSQHCSIPLKFFVR